MGRKARDSPRKKGKVIKTRFMVAPGANQNNGSALSFRADDQNILKESLNLGHFQNQVVPVVPVVKRQRSKQPRDKSKHGNSTGSQPHSKWLPSLSHSLRVPLRATRVAPRPHTEPQIQQPAEL